MIEINNTTEKKVDSVFLNKVALFILKKEKRELDISVAFIGQEEIKEINIKYRKKHKPTDVLSFFYGDSGEIIICLSVVEKQAKGDFKKELTKVFIHGLLHILGYNHEKTKKESEIMRDKQNYYLKELYK